MNTWIYRAAVSYIKSAAYAILAKARKKRLGIIRKRISFIFILESRNIFRRSILHLSSQDRKKFIHGLNLFGRLRCRAKTHACQHTFAAIECKLNILRRIISSVRPRRLASLYEIFDTANHAVIPTVFIGIPVSPKGRNIDPVVHKRRISKSASDNLQALIYKFVGNAFVKSCRKIGTRDITSPDRFQNNVAQLANSAASVAPDSADGDVCNLVAAEQTGLLAHLNQC